MVIPIIHALKEVDDVVTLNNAATSPELQDVTIVELPALLLIHLLDDMQSLCEAHQKTAIH